MKTIGSVAARATLSMLAAAATQPVRKHAMTIALEAALVERPAPGAAPTAFRIWAAGENQSDDGPIYFTEESAALLLAEQEARARRYAFDFDHLSLQSDRPADAGRASGWHSLEVRPNAESKPELWAVAIEWCADVKAGLEETPPRWRYFSPAFVTKGDEVVSYINCALCINPLTHGLPSLASRTATEGKTMTKEQAKALYAKICAGEATDEEKKAFADAMPGFLGGDDDKKDEKKDAEETAPDSEKKEAKAEDGTDDEKKPDEKQESKAHGKKPVAAAVDPGRALATDLASANARLAALEIERMLDTRADLFGTDAKPTSIRAWAKTQTPDNLKSYLASAPKPMAAPAEKTTHGGGADGGPGDATGLQGRELEEVNRAMGMRSKQLEEPKRVYGEEAKKLNVSDGTFVVPTITPREWRAHCAKKNTAAAKSAGKDGG